MHEIIISLKRLSNQSVIQTMNYFDRRTSFVQYTVFSLYIVHSVIFSVGLCTMLHSNTRLHGQKFQIWILSMREL